MDAQGIDTKNGPALEAIIPVLSERAKTLKELAASSRYFYQEFEAYDEKLQRKTSNLKRLHHLQNYWKNCRFNGLEC